MVHLTTYFVFKYTFSSISEGLFHDTIRLVTKRCYNCTNFDRGEWKYTSSHHIGNLKLGCRRSLVIDCVVSWIECLNRDQSCQCPYIHLSQLWRSPAVRKYTLFFYKRTYDNLSYMLSNQKMFWFVCSSILTLYNFHLTAPYAFQKFCHNIYR